MEKQEKIMIDALSIVTSIIVSLLVVFYLK